jgi:hypothetical protein
MPARQQEGRPPRKRPPPTGRIVLIRDHRVVARPARRKSRPAQPAATSAAPAACGA